MTLELLAHLELSAASGLVHRDEALYCVADDGLELLRTDLSGAHPARLPLGEGPRLSHLPKAHKPDFEALLAVGDTLLALGSGSSPARRRAVQVDARGRASRVVDLGPLYDALGARLDELNIEGAVISGDDVFLAQRGNGAFKENALVRLERRRFEQDLAAGALTAACLVELLAVSLGELDGVPLSLTDLCLGPRGQLIFTAAAEATDNPYDDGEVAGSVIGVLDRAGRVDASRRVVAPKVKLEGVCWLERGELRLVADPDDPSAKAPLFRLGWPR